MARPDRLSRARRRRTLTPTPVTARTYGPAPSQFVHVYGEDTGRRAVVLHGGFWRVAYSLDLMVPLCLDLARRGWEVWNVEYRRVGERGGGWPGTFQDVAAAVALVPEGGPLIIVGHSAGGQLALYAATRRSADAVVALAPVADLHLAQELALSSDAASELMGGVPDEVGDRYDRTSPTRLVPLGAPILVLFGQDDDVVPTVLGERFVEAARAAGDIADLLVLEAIDHMDVIDPVSRAWRAAVAWVAGRVGELPPPDFC